MFLLVDQYAMVELREKLFRGIYYQSLTKENFQTIVKLVESSGGWAQ